MCPYVFFHTFFWRVKIVYNIVSLGIQLLYMSRLLFFFGLAIQKPNNYITRARHGQYRNRNDLSPTPNHEFLRKKTKISSSNNSRMEKNILHVKCVAKLTENKVIYAAMYIFYKSPIGIDSCDFFWQKKRKKNSQINNVI